ncbi:T-cell surface glycoprotein CD1a-like [Ochotona princeps]|uniref:T-cell surface glycoprotein CD1a-like n=1 Tax=Ochotona princeps TaxID=9978 RepID=UPI0027145D72|nr:T-cell surface glycoprotein CD1a-like [Ochotona princeps]
MLLLLLALLVALSLGGNNTVGFKEPVYFQIIQISSFYNHSWAENWLSGWLGELQIDRWDSELNTLVFLQSWSRDSFSHKELVDIQASLHAHFIRFTQETQTFARKLQLEYPFVLQVASRCELHSGEASVGFVREAYQGIDFLSLENNSWLPSPQGGSRAQQTCQLLNLYEGLKERIHWLLSDACPRFALRLLDAGKEYLQRQEKPEAWLSNGPSPGPGQLLLVCRVSGFYPKPVWVTWMRDNREQPGTEQSDILPNADGTWYLRVTLEVTAGEADGLSCQVKHSSLGDQDIILHWGHHNSVGFILLAVMLLLALLTGLAFWSKKRW